MFCSGSDGRGKLVGSSVSAKGLRVGKGVKGKGEGGPCARGLGVGSGGVGVGWSAVA